MMGKRQATVKSTMHDDDGQSIRHSVQQKCIYYRLKFNFFIQLTKKLRRTGIKKVLPFFGRGHFPQHNKNKLLFIRIFHKLFHGCLYGLSMYLCGKWRDDRVHTIYSSTLVGT